MRKLFLVLVLMMGTAGVAQSSYAPAKPKEDPAFAALRQQWAANLRTRQIDASLAAYAPDAVFLQPDGSTVQGTEALRKLFTTLASNQESRVLFFLSKVTESGDKATDSGQFRTLQTAAGHRQMIQGGYTTEYRRAASGKWLIARQQWQQWGQPVALDLAAHPVVALTFDDLPAAGSPVPGMTRTQVATQLATELKAAHLEGTYGFVNGIRIENNPDVAEALHAWLGAGMNIGSHTWSHPALSDVPAFHPLPVDQYIANIAQNEAVLSEYGQLRDWKWFRYPFLQEGDTLEKRHAVRNWLFAHGYHVAQVTLDFEDYAWNDAYGRCLTKNDPAALQWLHDSYLATAREYIQLGREEEIVAFGHEIPNVLLMHETAFTAHMLPELIAALRAEGFSFESLPQVERDPAYAQDPDTALTYGGTLPDQFMDSKHLPYPPFDPKPFDKLNTLCK